MKDGTQYFIPSFIPPHYIGRSWGINRYIDKAVMESAGIFLTKEEAIQYIKRIKNNNNTTKPEF